MVMRGIMLYVALLPTGAVLQAQPIDEFRLSDIEQNIRTLQSEVREQARQIVELQRQTGQRTVAPASTPRNDASSERWLSLANWNRIKPGMTELQVIELLGAPTQQRTEDAGSRRLLYTLEIGHSGYLSGRVLLKEGKVSGVEVPSLK